MINVLYITLYDDILYQSYTSKEIVHYEKYDFKYDPFHRKFYVTRIHL